MFDMSWECLWLALSLVSLLCISSLTAASSSSSVSPGWNGHGQDG